MPPRRPRPPSRCGHPPRAGLTLLELVVALAVTGLVLTLGVGAFLSRPVAGADAEAAAVVAMRSARALALRRGEAVTVRLADDGRWEVTGDASPDVTVAGTRLAEGRERALVVHVSAAGACLPEGSAALRWDPVRCAPVVAVRERGGEGAR